MQCSRCCCIGNSVMQSNRSKRVLLPANVTTLHLFISLTSSSWLIAPLMRLTCEASKPCSSGVCSRCSERVQGWCWTRRGELLQSYIITSNTLGKANRALLPHTCCVARPFAACAWAASLCATWRAACMALHREGDAYHQPIWVLITPAQLHGGS